MNITAINLNLLVAFDALLREHSVTRAAKRVGVTQAALSNALAQLRTVFDDQLFIRAAHGMTPTRRALELADPVQRGLALLSSALTPTSFEPKSSERTFTLAANDYCEQIILPPLMRRISAEAPQVRIHVRPWGLLEVPDTLAKGEADLMLGFYRGLPAHHLEQRLFDEHFVCIVRKGHPLVKKRLTLETYLKLSHVLVSQHVDSPGVVDNVLAQRGLKRHVGARVSHFMVVPFVVAQTDMVAAVNARVARSFEHVLPIRLLPPPIPLPVGYPGQVWHARNDTDPGHRWLRELIAKVSREV